MPACAVEYEAVVDYFKAIFHGNGTDGLILRERWMARDGLFERLAQQFQLAVFTGRLRWEAELTLYALRAAFALRSDRRHGRCHAPEARARGPAEDLRSAGISSAGTSATRWTMHAVPREAVCRSSASRRRRIRATRIWLRS